MDLENGLSSQQVEKQREKYGFNELEKTKNKTLFTIVIEVFKEPMFLLLLACGVLYVILGDYLEGIVLLSTILIMIGMTIFQHRKTQQALEALKQLASPRAMVLRNREHIRIPGREVVPKDIIILNEGDRIPADGILIDGSAIHVDESMLTGESIPVIRTKTENQNELKAATLVTQGSCMMLVNSIGSSTQFGKIGQSLGKIQEETTPLQKEMAVFIRQIGIIGLLLCLSVMVLFYFTRGDIISSILSGLSAAMAILPEEFPLVLTVFLALGAWRMSKKNVLTRKSSAIETLGSSTVLCSDKTGTITQNKMHVEAVWHNGKWAGIEEAIIEFKHALTIGRLATTSTGNDPMDLAVIRATNDLTDDKTMYSCLKTLPFSHQYMAVTSFYQLPDGKVLIASKGAPEQIFNQCKLDSVSRSKLASILEEKAAEGYRIIALASARIEESEISKELTHIPFTFEGFLALADPIRPEVPEAITQCLSAGVKVIMITGDFPETARSIGKQIGLATSTIITGDELNTMNDMELRSKLSSTSILARIKPDQKLRIVEALKENGEIVAMTGDGVNDAPALKAAHIGIAMGQKGTDVAREASSIVLLDDNFSSIVSAIRMGRKLFDNLQKAMSYIIAVHIPIIGLTLLPAFIPALPVFLLPLHIVFMELIIDPVCSVVFESEEEEEGIMNRPPRNPAHRFFGMNAILRSSLHGFFLFAMVFCVYFISLKEGHTEEECRAITFSALIIGNITLIISKLSRTKFFYATLFSHNWRMKLLISTALIAIVIILNTPSIAQLFSMRSPGWSHLIISLIGGISLLLVLEIGKKFITYFSPVKVR